MYFPTVGFKAIVCSLVAVVLLQHTFLYVVFAQEATSGIVEPVVEPVVEPIVELVVEPVVEPIVELVVEPVVEPIVEPVPGNEPNLSGDVADVLSGDILSGSLPNQDQSGSGFIQEGMIIDPNNADIKFFDTLPVAPPFVSNLHHSYHKSMIRSYLKEIEKKATPMKSVAFSVDTSVVKEKNETIFRWRDESGDNFTFTFSYDAGRQKLIYDAPHFPEVPLLWVDGVQTSSLPNDGLVHSVLVSFSQPWYGKFQQLHPNLLAELLVYDVEYSYNLIRSTLCYNSLDTILDYSTINVGCIY